MRTVARTLAACALALPGLVGLVGCGAGDSSADAHDGDQPPSTEGAQPVRAELFTSEYGVLVGIAVGFEEDRVVTGARLLWAGGSDDISLYPLDGSDPDQPPEQLRLSEGTEVLLEGTVLAACPDVPDVLVFEVESRVGDDERTDRYLPEPSANVEQAFQKWCDRPVTMTVTGSQQTPGGDYEVYLEFSNPGPGVVTVISEAVTLGEATWEESRVEVPPGTRTPMTVHGHGGDGCGVTAPWQEGHVLVDGRPITPNGVATAEVDERC